MPRTPTIAFDLAKMLEESTSPTYVVDDRRRIVFCNQALARWTGVRASELLGQTCVYHTPGESPVAASGLCPPPRAFCGQATVASVHCVRRDGQTRFRRGRFLPLGDGQDESADVLVVLDEVDSPPDTDPPPEDFAHDDGRLHEQVRAFRQQMADRYRADSLIGRHPAIARVRSQVELAAKAPVSVLILGRGGTGKDHVARAIHYQSEIGGNLVELACGVLEPNMLQSTFRALATRNARQPKLCGTLVLDEVDSMPAEVQAELWDLLRGDKLRMRMIAQASAPLDPAIAAGRLSAPLAAALSTLLIELPPLARRTDDIPALAQLFLEESNAVGLKQVGGFASDALELLTLYPWPGNVDELAVLVAQAHAAAQTGVVQVRDLPAVIHHALDAAAHPPRRDEPIVLEEYLANVERELLTRALKRAKGNKSKAAKMLGLTRPRLYRRLVQLGLEKPGSA